MDKKEQFKEALDGLLEKARGQGSRLTEQEIREGFPGMELTEEQWSLIEGYLDFNRVAVAGKSREPERASGEKASLSGEDSRCYRMYLEELEGVRQLGAGEAEALAAAAAGGDRTARNRLAEGYLRRVVELAREYAGRGVLMSDLIQEGNMALLMAVDTFGGGDFGVHITREICTAMDAAIAEQTGQDDTGSYLAAQANAMMKATEELVEELGREATLKEVADRMKLSEDMARDIMKISMDALSLAEAGGSGEVYGHTGGEHEHCGCGHEH